jgi:hypothetical protein
VVIRALVDKFVRVSLAPATTAEVWSLTKPEMLPTGDAKSEVVPDKRNTATRTCAMCRGRVVMSAS